jgi:hypothetical protein
MKHRYKLIINRDGGTQEVQFQPLDHASPRLASLYLSDPVDFDRFKHGEEREVDPEEHAKIVEQLRAKVDKVRAIEAARSIDHPGLVKLEGEKRVTGQLTPVDVVVTDTKPA